MQLLVAVLSADSVDADLTAAGGLLPHRHAKSWQLYQALTGRAASRNLDQLCSILTWVSASLVRLRPACLVMQTSLVRLVMQPAKQAQTAPRAARTMQSILLALLQGTGASDRPPAVDCLAPAALESASAAE